MEKENVAEQEVIEQETETPEEEIESSEVEENEEEKPLFLLEEDEEESDEEKVVPVGALVKTRKKLQGRIQEKDDEVQRLNKKIEELEKRTSSAKVELPKRPKVDDFDSDEEYDKALDDWYDLKTQASLKSLQDSQNQNINAQNQQKKIIKSVENHYERAEKLVKEHAIKPEVCQSADKAVREATEAILPGKGDSSVDHLINVLGDGSEKTLYYLGRNKNALNEYRAILQEDTTGLKAAAFLGRLSERINGTTKRKSKAPAPAPQANGNAEQSVSESVIKKKYDAAHKKGNTQEAFNIKREAKKQGLDTSK